MSNGRASIACIESRGGQIYVGSWWSNHHGNGASLDVVPREVDRPVDAYLSSGETVQLIAALMHDLSEYERSLIPEQLASLERARVMEDCPKLSGAELDQRIGEHNEQQWRVLLPRRTAGNVIA
jgi:hypothetical protein